MGFVYGYPLFNTSWDGQENVNQKSFKGEMIHSYTHKRLIKTISVIK